MPRACALALLAAAHARSSRWRSRCRARRSTAAHPRDRGDGARADRRSGARPRPRHRRGARGRGGLPRRLRSARVGKPATVDADTVFQIASMSKPVSATVVAKLVGEDLVAWDSRMVDLNPRFALHDPYPTAEVTLRDLFAHRSGLPGTSGDDLEAIGYDRDTIMQRLRLIPPVVELPRRLRLQQRRPDPGRAGGGDGDRQGLGDRRRGAALRAPRHGLDQLPPRRLPGAREPGGAARQARRHLGGAGAARRRRAGAGGRRQLHGAGPGRMDAAGARRRRARRRGVHPRGRDRRHARAADGARRRTS